MRALPQPKPELPSLSDSGKFNFVPSFKEVSASPALKGPKKPPDSSLFNLKDMLSGPEIKALDALIEDHLYDLVAEVSQDIADFLFGAEEPVEKPLSFELGKRALSHPGKSALVPKTAGLAQPDLGTVVSGDISFGGFLAELTAEICEIDDNELSLSTLRDATRCAIDILFAEKELDLSSEKNHKAIQVALIKRLNSPGLQLSHAALLRLILKCFQNAFDKNPEKGEGATCVKKKLKVLSGRNTTAALDDVIHTMATSSTDPDISHLFDIIDQQDPEIVICHGDEVKSVKLVEFVGTVVRYTHLISRIAIEKIPRRYIRLLASGQFLKLTSSINLNNGRLLTNEHLRQVSRFIDESVDPAIKKARKHYFEINID
jgi:hypothetical protein